VSARATPHAKLDPAWWSPWSAPGATLACLGLALLFTWPLATAPARSIPWDMGDPVLNAWIQAWSAEHLRRVLGGDLHAFAGYWHAPIFHPAPLALAYSEHLFAQAVQVLPIWALTRNAVLCYNVTLVATFVLSGLGAFLLARDLTGDARAALVAGVAFAFAPYRIAQLSHVQVLSAQWMPFVLFAVRRHLDTGTWRSLAGLAAAALLNHLSCGYYLVFFAPFVSAFVVLEITARRRWRDGRLLGRLGLAALVVGAGTWPFVAPYLELRALGFSPRPLDEVIRFSANAWSYASAHPAQWLWGGVFDVWVRPEGELFPGVTVLVLAAAGTVAALHASWSGAPASAPARGWRRAVLTVVCAGVPAGVSVALVVLVAGPVSFRVLGSPLRASSVGDALAASAACAAALLVLSPRARHATRVLLASRAAWFSALAAAGFVLSLGPVAGAGPEVAIGHAPYGWLYAHVPGYDGLRVPARHAMLVVLGLSVLAAYGVRAIPAASRRRGALAACLALAILAEGGAAPLPLDRAETAEGLSLPPAQLPNAADPPPVYAFVRDLPGRAVLAEFPFGTPAWDVRYAYATLLHGHRILNGYSGGVPLSYAANAGALADVTRDPDVAWSRLAGAGATHAVVHEAAYPAGRGAAVTGWLVARGARRLARFGSDEVLALPSAGLE
jgi:hypothetical protein